MKAGANATIEDEPTTDVAATINKIDEQLEKFIGIRDLDLSTTMHQLAKTATEPEIFAGLLDQHLSDFEFPDDFVLDVCSPFINDLRYLMHLTSGLRDGAQEVKDSQPRFRPMIDLNKMHIQI